jgi:hypothetical protein
MSIIDILEAVQIGFLIHWLGWPAIGLFLASFFRGHNVHYSIDEEISNSIRWRHPSSNLLMSFNVAGPQHGWTLLVFTHRWCLFSRSTKGPCLSFVPPRETIKNYFNVKTLALHTN